MNVNSFKQAQELLDTSMRQKGFYEVEAVEALLRYAQYLESRLDAASVPAPEPASAAIKADGQEENMQPHPVNWPSGEYAR